MLKMKHQIAEVLKKEAWNAGAVVLLVPPLR